LTALNVFKLAYNQWHSFYNNSSELTVCVSKQEAQLSQRDRTTLRVIEYFAESLKVIKNDTVEQGVCKSLLVFQ